MACREGMGLRLCIGQDWGNANSCPVTSTFSVSSGADYVHLTADCNGLHGTLGNVGSGLTTTTSTHHDGSTSWSASFGPVSVSSGPPTGFDASGRNNWEPKEH